MNTSAAGLKSGQRGTNRGVLLQAVFLLTLFAVAFRRGGTGILSTAIYFSEWSHAMVLPWLGAAFLWCRRHDLRAAVTQGSNAGMFVLLLGAGLWIAARSLGLFAYFAGIGMLISGVGVVLYLTGWRLLRLCIPLVLMAWLSLPLSERSMERFSLGLQRGSLHAARLGAEVLPGVEVRVQGATLAYSYGDRQGAVGLAEQRFGLRLFPACFTVALFTVFTRRREGWQIVLLTILSVPLVLACNVLRIMVWTAVAVYGGLEPISSVPRNASLAAMLVATYLVFSAACFVVAKLSLLQNLVVVETSDDDQQDEAAEQPDQSMPGVGP
jgi:hypothetical protein